MASPQEIIGAYMAQELPGAIVTGVVAVVEVLTEEGARSAYVLWDEQSTLWSHIGLAKVLTTRLEERVDCAP